MIELRHLLHVLAVAEHRSFSRAAETLRLTQPALTRSIQAAEKVLGVRLFDRDRSGVELTEFGRLVVEQALPTVQAVSDLEREIELRKGIASGGIAVTLAPYPGAISGQHAVARFVAAHPGISCRVHAGDWMRASQDVLDGNVDLAIADVSTAADHPGLSTEKFNTSRVWFVCSSGHALVGRPVLSIDELTEYPWVTTRVPARMRPDLPDRVGRCGHWDNRTGDFIPAVLSDFMGFFADVARDSDALVACTLTMVEADLEAGRVVPLPFSAPWLRLNYGVIVRVGRTLSPAAREFLRIVREVEAELDLREAVLRERFLS